MYNNKDVINLIKLADDHNRHLLRSKGGDFQAARDFLMRKLMEESGEYSEAVTLDQGDSTRKLRKFDCLDKNNVINYSKLNEVAKEMLHEEVTDIVYISMRLARLEKVSLDEMLKRINKKKDYR